MDHRLGFNFGFLRDLEGEYPSNVTPKAPRLTPQQEKLNRALDFVGCSETVLPAGDYWLTVNKTKNPCKEILYIDESPWIPQVFIDRCTLAFEAPSKPKSMVGVYQENPYSIKRLLELLKGADSITLHYNDGSSTNKGKYKWIEPPEGYVSGNGNGYYLGSLWDIEYKNDAIGIKGFTIESMKY